MADQQFWTPERDAIITRMWLEGIPSGEIAKSFPTKTRNSIIGRLRRLGLVPRPADAKPSAPKLRLVATPEPLKAPTPPTGVAPPRSQPKQLTNPVKEKPVSKPTPAPGFRFGDKPPSEVKKPYIPKERAWMPLEGSTPVQWESRPFNACPWPLDGENGETLSCCNKAERSEKNVSGYCSQHYRLSIASRQPAPLKSRDVRRYA